MDETTKPARRLIKVQEFIEFLIAKKVKSTCVSCGYEESWVSSDDDPLYAAQTKSEITEFNLENFEIKQHSTNVVLECSVICGNCGYIRSYASLNVYEWLDQRAKSAQVSQ